MRKVLKVMTMYPEDNPLPSKMRGSFGVRFVEQVNRFNGFTFSIRPNEIIYNREVVFQDPNKDEALASFFYNAGIVYLEFQEGLTNEELISFLDVLKVYLKDGSDDCDLVSLIWQEQFKHIKFKTVEDLALGECETDTMISEMYPDYQKDLLYKYEIDHNRIILDDNESPDDDSASTGARSLSPEAVKDGQKMGLDLETDPDEIPSPIEKLLSHSYTLAEEESLEIDKIINEVRQFDPDRTVVRILIEIVDYWEDQRPFKETIAICERIFDQLLNKGSFAVIADFISVLRQRLEVMSSQFPKKAELLTGFIRRAGDDMRIKKLTEIINRQEKVDTVSIENYLEALGWESLVPITGMLGQLVSKDARLMVCDYLARSGRDHVNIIANGLRDKRWYVTRNTAMILGHIGGDQALHYLATITGHSDHRVRREIIKALGNYTSDRAVDILFEFLKDPEPKLRRTALNYLTRMGGRRAFESIRNIVHSASFMKYPIEEQEQFLITYSRLGGSEVTDFLGSIVGSFSFFNNSWKARYRFMALKALAFNSSTEAEALILKYTHSRRKWLRQAAVNALEQHRGFMYQKEEEEQ
jgi:hypothetical protein